MTTKLSLHVRVLGIGFFVLIVLFGTAFYYYRRLEEDYLDERMQTKARYVTNIVRRMVEQTLVTRNLENLREGLQDLLTQDDELASLRVQLVAPGLPEVYVISKPTALSPLRFIEQRRRLVELSNKKTPDTGAAAASPFQDLGTLTLGFWQRSLLQSSEASILNTIIIIDLLVLFGLFLHLLLRELVTRPLENFVEATRRVSVGDLSAQLVLGGGTREEERLATSFAEMIDRLRQSREEINRVNADLEQRVVARTEELRQEKTASETVSTSIADGLYTVDADRVVRVFNAAAEKLTGFAAADVIGKKCYDVLKYPFCETNCILLRLHGTQRQADQERLSEEYLEELPADGRTWLVSGSLFQARGGFAGGVESIKDLSYAREMQRKMRQLDKLTSLGILSAGVAHEINNPLSNIKIYGQLLQEDLEKAGLQAHVKDSLRSILEQTDRANVIVRKMLEFARQTGANMESVDIAEIISQSLEMVRYMIGTSGIEVNVEIAEDMPPIAGNRISLQQVFVNLFNNAWQAMKAGGTLTVRAFSERRGDQVVVTVGDTGSGIKESDLGRIFDPFFTTKDVGEGTGLGLSISYGIIKDHRGEVSVESAEGKGTTFTIRLPGPGARRAVN